MSRVNTLKLIETYENYRKIVVIFMRARGHDVGRICMYIIMLHVFDIIMNLQLGNVHSNVV